MLAVIYSQQTEALGDAFVDEARRLRQAHGAFEPLHVIVPNRNVDEYLRRRLAEREGIAIQLEAQFISPFVSRLARTSGARVFVPDRDMIRGALVARLSEPLGPALEPVSRWILGGGEHLRSTEARRVELATHLAQLFEEYAFSRASMLEDWLSSDETPIEGVAAWQRVLYRDLFGQGGLLRRGAEVGDAFGRDGLSLAEFVRTLDASSLGLRHVSVFGFSYLAPTILRFFERLARDIDVTLYTLNPCREFWEDAAKSRSLSEDPASDVAENPLLAAWGRPGREYVQMLDALTNYGAEPRFVEQSDDSLLRRVQRDVLERKSPELFGATVTDGSLEIVACPSPRREAEYVAQSIWERIEASASTPTPLGLQDFAVLVNAAERDRYVPELELAFARTHGIEHSVVDLPLSSTSAFAWAASRLLALPSTDLGRADVLSICTHSSFLARFPELSADAIVEWVDALGVVSGADTLDRRTRYETHDRYHWDQALRRLALGTLARGQAELEQKPVHFSESTYLPLSASTDRREEAALFGLALRSLLADVTWARDQSLTIAAWTRFFLSLVDVYLAAASTDDERHRLRVRESIASLSELPLGEKKVSYFLALELVNAAIEGVSVSGAVSAGGGRGVVISSLLPMRALPFRVVFVVGLNEGTFPASDRLDPLDLRRAERIAGDVTPKERDCYLLLEALTSARDAFVATHTARHASTGDPLEPSPALRDLERVLSRGYGVQSQSLRSPSFFAHLDAPMSRYAAPSQARQASAVAIERALSTRSSFEGGVDAWRRFSNRADADSRAHIESLIGGVFERDAASEIAEPAVERVKLSALVDFLKCPLQASAKARLGLFDIERTDPLTMQREPFALNARDRSRALREAIERFLRNPPETRSPLVNEIDQLGLRGLAPAGLFADAEAERDRAVFDAWQGALDVLETGQRSELVHHVFGSGARHPSDLLHAPLRLSFRERALAITGRTRLFHRREPLSVHFDARSNKDGSETRARNLVDALVECSALAAHGVLFGDTFDHHVISFDGSRATDSVPMLSREAARAWLEALTQDLFTSHHAYLLPYEAVLHWHSRKAVSLVDVIAEFVDDAIADPERASISTLWGPVPRPLSYDLPTEEEARAMVERRFGPLFERLRAKGEA